MLHNHSIRFDSSSSLISMTIIASFIWIGSISMVASKINLDNFNQPLITAAIEQQNHHRHQHKGIEKAQPVFNVTGVLAIHSIESLDGCNRTHRILLNKWFLDECSQSSILCRRKRSEESMVNRNRWPSHRSEAMDSFREYLLSRYENDNKNEWKIFEQNYHNKDPILDRLERFDDLNKRNGDENYQTQAHLLQAQQAQEIIEKCCRSQVPICTETDVRNRFQSICSPNRIVSKEVFRS